MRSSRLLIAVTLVIALVAPLWAQEAATKPAVPAAAILTQLPAGTMGYMVVNEVQATLGNVDKFLAEIGMGDFVKAQAPKGMLEMLKTEVRLGEGFNPAGGFAFVMLDPQQFGIDFAQMVTGGRKPDKLPFAVYVPGSSVRDVFGAKYEITKPEGAKYEQVALRVGPMFATMVDGYVVLSPMDTALDAIVGAKVKADTELTTSQKEMIQTSAYALQLNMKVSGPVLDKMIKAGEEQMTKMQKQMTDAGVALPAAAKMQMSMTSNALPYYRKVLGQMDSMTAAVHMTKSGVAATAQIVFTKDSEMAKEVGASKVLAKSMLDRLPDLKYIVAMEVAGGKTADPKAQQEAMDMLLKSTSITQATKDKATQLMADWTKQVKSAQFVLGGPPTGGKGMISAAMVLQVEDAQATKDLIAQMAAVGQEMIAQCGKSATTAPADAEVAATAAAIKLEYKKDAQKAGDVSVDTLTVTGPEMSESDKAGLEKTLGQDQMQVLVAGADANTVVLTLGGGTATMTEALKVAVKGGGTVGGKEAEASVAEMPQKRSALILFNVGNLMNVIRANEPSAPNVTTQAPLAFSVAVDQGVVVEKVYVPSEVIKQFVDAWKQAMGGNMGAGEPEGASPAKTAPKEDF